MYGAEYEIWADLGPIGITGKIIEADYKQLLRLVFFMFLWTVKI